MSTQGGPGLSCVQKAKMSKMAILGQKWLFLAIFRGLCGVTCPETLACERSTHYSHTIKKSALYIENSKNGGQKGFAIPCVDVPLMAPKNCRFFAIFRGFRGVSCLETLACERSTHFPHNIKQAQHGRMRQHEYRLFC